MGRGLLTREEIMILNQNPYVEKVQGNRIEYSEEFKKLFVKEYFSGKKPRVIFEDAGFDVRVLGNKRIERCSARWRELNASGNLGDKIENNDFYRKNENEMTRLRRIIKEQNAEISRLKLEISNLEMGIHGK